MSRFTPRSALLISTLALAGLQLGCTIERGNAETSCCSTPAAWAPATR